MCDIADGAAFDCNANEVMDLCELDAQQFLLFDDFTAPQLEPSIWSDTFATELRTSRYASPPQSLMLNVQDWVESVDIDLSRQTDVTLRFMIQPVGIDAGDFFTIKYWDDGSWVQLFQFGNDLSQSVFTEQVFTIPAAALHATFRMRFESWTTTNFDEWYFDDVSVGVPVDANGDQVLDECAARGDFDGDGLVDLLDAAQFIGCLTGPAAPTSEACRPYDVSGDAFVDLRDAALLMTRFTGSPR